MRQDTIRVALLFGGRSPEHAISCLSAGAVLAALDRERFDVTPIGITREGSWVLAEDDPLRFANVDGALPEVTGGPALLAGADPTTPLLRPLGADADPALLDDIDVVFPLLHGAFGEDGTVQGLLAMAGVPYVGSGVFASAAAMDKDHAKTLLRAAGLEVADCVVLRAGDVLGPEERDRLGLPVFVKPARAGSSVGISRVTAWAELDDALAAARRIDDKVLVEAAVVGREIECGVLAGVGGAAPEASVPAEITMAGENCWYDFAAKYLDDSCTFHVPAQLDADVAARVADAATRTFRALDCADLARVDFFVTADGRIVVNEVNTMPGFTPISMFPRMWAASGEDYAGLLTRLIEGALSRSGRLG